MIVGQPVAQGAPYAGVPFAFAAAQNGLTSLHLVGGRNPAFFIISGLYIYPTPCADIGTP